MSATDVDSNPIASTPSAARPAARRRRMSWKKKLLFTAVVIAITLPVLCLIAEVGLRIFAPQRLLPRYVTDSGFGVRVHCPSIVTHHTTPEYRITIRTNSLGMRADREYSPEKPPGVIRIVTLGDSFTFGYEVELEQSYPYLLEKCLRENGIPAEIINLGVSGFGNAEELVMLEKRGLSFHPDIVLVGYYVNDIGDNMQSLLYVLDAEGRLTRKNDSYLPAVKLNNLLYSFAPYRWLAENSHLMCALRENLSEFVQKRLRKSNASAAAIDDTGERKLAAALLDEIRRVSIEHGAKFCLLEIPTMTNRSNMPRELLKAIVPGEIVDMRALQEGRDLKSLYWQRSDGHWNPAGHALATEALCDHLRVRLSSPESQ